MNKKRLCLGVFVPSRVVTFVFNGNIIPPKKESKNAWRYNLDKNHERQDIKGRCRKIRHYVITKFEFYFLISSQTNKMM